MGNTLLVARGSVLQHFPNKKQQDWGWGDGLLAAASDELCSTLVGRRKERGRRKRRRRPGRGFAIRLATAGGVARQACRASACGAEGAGHITSATTVEYKPSRMPLMYVALTSTSIAHM